MRLRMVGWWNVGFVFGDFLEEGMYGVVPEERGGKGRGGEWTRLDQTGQGLVWNFTCLLIHLPHQPYREPRTRAPRKGDKG